MADKLKLSVVTPEGSLFSGEASFVAAPAWDGEVGILPGHAAMIAALGTGELRIERDTLGGRVTDHYAVRGGFLQVLDDEITLLVTEAKTPEGIDVEVVKGSLEQILEDLRHPEDDEAYVRLLADRRWLETQQKVE
jgi:F-type H+-transporting ATPase subunit epsilon